MARTRAEDYDDKLNLILDEAARLFATRGFAGASIADVAKACKSSKSWLYHYFDGKDDILYTLLATHMKVLAAAAERAFAASNNAEAQFRALVRENMRIYAKAKWKHMVLLNEINSLPRGRKAEIVEAERRLVSGVADLIERLRPGLGRSRRLRWPYAMMFYGIINWTQTWYDAKGPVGPDEFADRAATLFLDGLRRAKP